MYGLVGSGRTEVALSILKFPPDSGTILLYGKPIALDPAVKPFNSV